MYVIVDKQGVLCEYATKYYKTSSGAKNAFNRAREVFMERWFFGLEIRSPFSTGWYKWVFKSHLHPLDCIGKNFDCGLFPGPGLTQTEAKALAVKYDEFNSLYEIREVELTVNLK